MLTRTKPYSGKGANQAGFTLTEVAIVLLLISAVLSAAWVAAGGVNLNSNVVRASKQVQDIAQNIREQYVAVQTPLTWTTGGANLNVALDAKNVFPIEMRASPNLAAGAATQLINHPLASTSSGSLSVFYDGDAATTTLSPAGPAVCSATVPCFRVWLYGLNNEACTKLVRALPIDDAALGITQLGVTNTSGACTGATCVLTTLPTVTAATGWCNGTNRDNTVFWDFKLHN